MYQRILVPLDGSARAEQAVAVAARLARVANGAVVLIEVANLHLEYGRQIDAPGLAPIAVDRDDEDAVDYLKTITQRPELAGIATETEVLSGPIAETILNAAQTHGADVIVMSSHGRTGFRRRVLGSVAEQVTQHAKVPVLVLRDAEPALMRPTAEAGRRFTALVPLDGSPLAEAALQPAVELVAALAAPEQGALHLMQVVDIPMPRDDQGLVANEEEQAMDQREGAHEDARAYLASVTQRLQKKLTPQHRVAITSSVAYDVNVAEAIIDTAEGRGDIQHPVHEAPCDVIAMATHGRGGLDRWAMGSVTDEVLRGTGLPLLVVRPQTIVDEAQAPG
jgi:nucleotide-binding universal stress UspA family protein